MQTALEVLRKHTGLTVTDLDAVRMQTKIEYVEQAMQDYAKIYACEKVKEALKVAAEHSRVLYSPNVGTHNVSQLMFSGDIGNYQVDLESILSLETEILNQINKEG